MSDEVMQPAEQQNTARTVRPSGAGSDLKADIDLSEDLDEGSWIEWTDNDSKLRGRVMIQDGNTLSMQMANGEFVDIDTNIISFEQLSDEDALRMDRELEAAEANKKVSESKKPSITKQVTDPAPLLFQYVYFCAF